MTEQFGALSKHAAETGLPDWNRSYNGLAAVLLMDQFSRQAFPVSMPNTSEALAAP